jgi:lipopolysaccharide transport system ATP-binding protein
LIQAKEITKEYRGFSSAWDRILAGLSFGYLGGKIRFRALDQVSFTCSPGEILGIIGRNGAGKSSLLKLITGVSAYDSGSLVVQGQVRSILELGVGFNPELSGEENVYYNGLVWGYPVSEMDRIIEEVFRFSGLSGFRNTPLKNYSSGMVMRLGFALATATVPEILIVDEALAVGDASFQQKCLRKFSEFQSKGTSTLIVSHDLGLLGQICTRILVMDKGQLVFEGKPAEAIQRYMQLIAMESWEAPTGKIPTDKFFKDLHIQISRKNQVNPSLFFVGENLDLSLSFQILEKIPQLTIGFHLDDGRGVRVYGTNTYHQGLLLENLKPGSTQRIQFSIPLNFGPGKYSLGLSLHQGESHVNSCYFWEEGLFSFELEAIGIPKFIGTSYTPIEISTDIRLDKPGS